MTDTPWTPGPWFFHPEREYEGHDPSRAMVTMGGVGTDAVDDVEVRVPANARLIAAAPEMAELLERVARQTTAEADEAIILLARIRGEA